MNKKIELGVEEIGEVEMNKKRIESEIEMFFENLEELYFMREEKEIEEELDRMDRK